MSIHVKGNNGESILFDGSTVTKFRHHGKDEAARVPVDTYREAQVKHKKPRFGGAERYDALLVMGSIFALSFPPEVKPEWDNLVAAIEAAAA